MSPIPQILRENKAESRMNREGLDGKIIELHPTKSTYGRFINIYELMYRYIVPTGKKKG